MIRDAFRPTTTLAGPASVTSLRQALFFALCLVLWYFAASLVLDRFARLAPAPSPARGP